MTVRCVSATSPSARKRTRQAVQLSVAFPQRHERRSTVRGSGAEPGSASARARAASTILCASVFGR
eukprot:13195622-Alexandrium_andersonii.AAC.1